MVHTQTGVDVWMGNASTLSIHSTTRIQMTTHVCAQLPETVLSLEFLLFKEALVALSHLTPILVGVIFFTDSFISLCVFCNMFHQDRLVFLCFFMFPFPRFIYMLLSSPTNLTDHHFTTSPLYHCAESFHFQTFVDGFTTPTDFSFADSGELFVAEKQGRVWYYNPETQVKKLWIDLSSLVHNAGDRGLLGITTHPGFQNNRFVFLLFTLDPARLPQNDIDLGNNAAAEVPTANVLVRIEDIGTSPKIINGEPDLIYLIGGNPDGQTFEPFKQPIVTGFNSHAIGKVKFGLDGTLLVSAGDGAHWDFGGATSFYRGDWGQGGTQYDYLLARWFGEKEDIGAMRSQSVDSMGGKILRIHAGTGQGICDGSGFAVLNPFCDGDPSSTRSKIWAMGVRNPFSMTVKPLLEGNSYDGGPGVIYFGDVGEGGFEEINAITEGGQNFGWPCWEGPIPMPTHSQNPFQTNRNFFNLTTDDGDLLNCHYMFSSIHTELPMYFYQRRGYDDTAGYYRIATYLGHGFEGNCVGGLEFYSGSSYPEYFHGALFHLDFAQGWIHTIKGQSSPYNDVFDHHRNFVQTEYAGALYSFGTEPNSGNICFLTRNEGSLVCVEYIEENVAPTVQLRAQPATSSSVPVDIKFDMDGTRDRENDFIFAEWDFGDGSAKSTDVNPIHTYTTEGQFIVTLTVVDVFGKKTTAETTVVTNNASPIVTITSPTTNGNTYLFADGEILTFSASVSDDATAEADLSYKWDVHIVHNDHRHIESRIVFTPSWTSDIALELGDAHKGTRANFAVILHVSDSQGLIGTDEIWLSSASYVDTLTNSPPETFFVVEGFNPYQAGQPIIFNALEMRDPDLDTMLYKWDFGDGTSISNEVYTSQAFSTAGTYDVTLTVRDNWGAVSNHTETVVVGVRTFIPPLATPRASDRYSSFNLSLTSSVSGGGVEIWYTTDGSDPSVSGPTSLLYSDPFLLEYVVDTSVSVKAIAVLDNEASIPASLVAEFVYDFVTPPCEQLALSKECQLTCFNKETALNPSDTLSLLREVETPDRILAPPSDATYSLSLEIDSISGTFDSSKAATSFQIYVDSSSVAGRGLKVRASYDFTGDGIWDR